MVDPLTHDLLTWIAGGRRTYAETLEVWPSSCPRLAVWEDALIAVLVEIVREGSRSEVRLTAAGRAALDDQRNTVEAKIASECAEFASAKIGSGRPAANGIAT
ncbi:MAG TPA: hypothetical protein VGJ25_05525 [Gaiellaceae bacterium]